MSEQDEAQAIQREIAAFTEAFARADASELASFFTQDGVRVGALGDIQRGRAELEAGYRKFFEGPFAGSKVALERGFVRMLGPGLALWQSPMTLTGRGGTIKGYVVQLMAKVDGRWLVLESHPKIFPRPPG